MNSNISSERHYFNIGVFVLIGLGLIIATILIFGSSNFFKPVNYVETYFDESIKTITVGSQVKYRGVQIGYIKDIKFMTETYKNYENFNEQQFNRAIYVRMAITSKLFTGLSKKMFVKLLTDEISNGLRARIVSQGLTGVSYIEFDYVADKSLDLKTLLKLPWTPKDFYIPSVKSTLTKISEDAQDILTNLSTIDFNKIAKNSNELLNSVTAVSLKVENFLDRIDSNLESSLQNLKIVSGNMRTITEQLKLNPSGIVFGKPPPHYKFE